MAMEQVDLFKVFMSKDAGDDLKPVLQSGYVSQGPKVEEFEAALGSFFGNKRVLTLNSGTAGLHLAFRLLLNPHGDWPGIQEGDEVLSTPLTCTASNWPVLANGIKLRWVDVDTRTNMIDLVDLERKLSPRTKVILFVHWGGVPVDLDAVAQICERAHARFGFRPRVVEDCAHAFGAEFNGKKLGNHGNLCMFSLQAIKHLTCGDGGLLIVPDDELYRRGKLIRWFGIDREARGSTKKKTDYRMEDDIPEWGYKFHMNDINATIGLSNLKHMDWLLARHRDNAAFYDTALAGLPGITAQSFSSKANPAYWLYTLQVDKKPQFIQHMLQRKIVVSQVHNRNDVHSCVADFKTDTLPNLDIVEDRLVCIPVGWWVEPQHRERVVEAIKEFVTAADSMPVMTSSL
jgi:dTDP-4-amino-4,6-dideoxygalactose transaminase